MSDAQQSHNSTVFCQAEETANAITHGIGMLLSLAGAVFLILRVVSSGRVVLIVACSVYALALVAVYTTSTLSHTFTESRQLPLLRRLDQAFIYVLIVATYTPLSVAYLHGVWWWTFLGLMWMIALIGLVFKLVSAHRVEFVALASYVMLGWMPIMAAPALIHIAPPRALWWILIGGLCYTIGTVFLFCDKRVRHFHAIWHMFVIAGSSFHFFVIVHIVSTLT